MAAMSFKRVEDGIALACAAMAIVVNGVAGQIAVRHVRSTFLIEAHSNPTQFGFDNARFMAMAMHYSKTVVVIELGFLVLLVVAAATVRRRRPPISHGLALGVAASFVGFLGCNFSV